MLQRQRAKALKQIIDIHKKEADTMKWLMLKDWSFLRTGDRILVINDSLGTEDADRLGTVRFTRRSKCDQLLVYFITDNGRKTHQVASNIRKL